MIPSREVDEEIVVNCPKKEVDAQFNYANPLVTAHHHNLGGMTLEAF